jgi:hypothetical protein
MNAAARIHVLLPYNKRCCHSQTTSAAAAAAAATHVPRGHHQLAQGVGRLLIDERLAAGLAVHIQCAIMHLKPPQQHTQGGQKLMRVDKGK